MNTITRYRSSDFVHKILMPKEKNQWEIDQWCKDQFGARWEAVGNRSGTWCCFWRGFKNDASGDYEWFFVNKDDAMWFSLRWA